ncbi:hypothetical protein HALA3H3_200095 [Halomonas sp. A3H3]|nr:hypothetical protein HALA3H3_200095 [Halomonas sp. A3H3]
MAMVLCLRSQRQNELLAIYIADAYDYGYIKIILRSCHEASSTHSINDIGGGWGNGVIT